MGNHHNRREPNGQKMSGKECRLLLSGGSSDLNAREGSKAGEWVTVAVTWRKSPILPQQATETTGDR